jgi:hypothetical protein
MASKLAVMSSRIAVCGQPPAQRRHERGLAGAHRTADADAQRLTRFPVPLGSFGVLVGFAVEEMRWHRRVPGLSGDEKGSFALAVPLGQHVE